MQVIYVDLSNRGAYPLIEAKQLDEGRKFHCILSDGGTPYSIPSDVEFAVWYSGPSGSGNYSSVDEEGAFSFDLGGSEVTVELVSQMLQKPGPGTLCLIITTNEKQIGLWNLNYIVENVPGAEDSETVNHHNSLYNSSQRAESAAQKAEEAAERAENFADSMGVASSVIWHTSSAPFASVLGSAFVVSTLIGPSGATPAPGHMILSSYNGICYFINSINEDLVVVDTHKVDLVALMLGALSTGTEITS